ncbi:MAG: NADP-dependent isocitrate dehydrogenase, partial [Cyanobacteria bacterium HKST-UBA05]|nr:NADP-dependent isocitrate dehydrogenase [Cyanobacteria bacterium HKST-UBA05]
DGLFHKIFDEVAAEYPNIENEHWIVDIGAAKLADTPENFDVIVMPNLYGDILSDVAAQITGSVGLAGSANIGENYAMFEAIHGSAPRRAGQNLANPSGLLLGAVLMLVHIGQPDVAEKVHNALLKTLEDGVHTYDLYKEGTSTRKVGTSEFADAVIERLGQRPEKLKAVTYNTQVAQTQPKQTWKTLPPRKKELVGIDVFLDWKAGTAQDLGQTLEGLSTDALTFKLVSSRGIKVYPDAFKEMFCADHWSCRFMAANGTITHGDVIALLGKFQDAGLDFIKTEHLCTFDGERGYTLAQGE